MIAPRLIAAGLLLTLAACVQAQPGPPLDRARLQLTFSENFASPPSFYDPKIAPEGRWKTSYAFSIQDTNHPLGWEARTLRPNKELEYYGDPAQGMSAFEWTKGSLAIVAAPNPYRADPRTHDLPYLSGLLTTQRSFTQRYGYFEARVTMPVGKGLWPAFWLLPAWRDDVGQQEIDVFENVGKDGEIYATVHTDRAGKKVADGDRIAVAAVGTPHDYGVLLTPQEVVWYVDSREVRRRPNKDFHEPAYMLLNLAVGGEWPGAPDATTIFPARMTIEWVRAYALRPAKGAP